MPLSRKEISRRYYLKHRDEILAKEKQWRDSNPDYMKNYYKDNKDRIDEKNNRWVENNRARSNEIKKEYKKRNPECIKKENIRRRSTIKGRLNDSISANIRNSLYGKKAGKSWEKLTGYSITDLMSHLEKLFEDEMTWDNYGKWHIDHVKPICMFNYSKPEDNDFKECWSLSNLQPLWAVENLRKGGKL